ncbi:MAG TPA: type IIL restriction-modification enzyme MmeI [Mycobacterium sp.]|nr:type IIL restriction-modification enzyme MmeI [Mycobacterium sp.]
MLGEGFILEPDQARALIERDPRNADVLFPYLNGEDLNSRPDCSASRWVINFHDWPVERAREYPNCFAIIEQKVRPERAKNNRKVYRDYWWQYAEKRPAMIRAIADLDRVLVIALVSKIGLPLWVPNRQVFSHMLGVFATAREGHMASLSSAQHFVWWTTKGESTLETRLRYTPSDGFETFPQPTLSIEMDEVGAELDSVRGGVMRERKVGLTALYNLVHDPDVRDADIARLRELHVSIDRAVRDAYAADEDREPSIREFEAREASEPLPAWAEIDLDHGFHATRQGMRFTVGPAARDDILDKLLALNHYRHTTEPRPTTRRPAKRPRPDPGGALF